jgi:uncharacterized membrane protein YkgB
MDDNETVGQLRLVSAAIGAIVLLISMYELVGVWGALAALGAGLFLISISP